MIDSDSQGEPNRDLTALIRAIPDHPKAGILFRDISTLMLDGPAFRTTIDRLANLVRPHDLGSKPTMFARVTRGETSPCPFGVVA